MHDPLPAHAPDQSVPHQRTKGYLVPVLPSTPYGSTPRYPTAVLPSGRYRSTRRYFIPYSTRRYLILLLLNLYLGISVGAELTIGNYISKLAGGNDTTGLSAATCCPARPPPLRKAALPPARPHCARLRSVRAAVCARVCVCVCEHARARACACACVCRLANVRLHCVCACARACECCGCVCV